MDFFHFALIINSCENLKKKIRSLLAKEITNHESGRFITRQRRIVYVGEKCMEFTKSLYGHGAKS